MWIRRITLKNWSAYENCVFDFPKSEARGKNVVLVGAKNGVGKTRLLEAITCCLFGVQCIDYLARAKSQHVQQTKYAKFLNGVFRRGVDAFNMSVKIEFEKDDGGKLSVERIWNFGADKKFQDETVNIMEDGIRVPSAPTDMPEDTARNYIAQNFIPPSLAPFFFFDSAQVQELARTEQSDQVRRGVKGILGIPILEELAEDLKEYAVRIRRSTKHIGDASIKATTNALNELDARKKGLEKSISSLTMKIDAIVKEHSGLLDEYEKIGGENMDALGELRRKEGQLDAELRDLRKRLADNIVGTFAFSIAGRELVDDTIAQISAEKVRGDWENTKKSGSSRYDKFVQNLDELKSQLSPPISDEQWAQLLVKMREAWNQLWYPSPAGAAKQIIHNFFDDSDRSDIVAHFKKLKQDGVAIDVLRDQIFAKEKEASGIAAKINSVSVVDPKKAEVLREKFKKCQKERDSFIQQRATKERDLVALIGQINAKTTENARLLEQHRRAEPQLQRASLADKSSAMIEKIINDAYPMHVREIEKYMLSSYMSMSNKQVVSDIKIGDDCVVRLLTEDGVDLRDVDPSHGESQIFTLSLIAAIVAVSRKNFPFVIDTPLGNLDSVHRPNFLSYYSRMENQVILLSTDTEVGKKELGLLSPKLAKRVLVDADFARGGVQSNIVRDGYFPDIER